MRGIRLPKKLTKGGIVAIVIAVALLAVGGGAVKAFFFGGTTTKASSSPVNLEKGLVGWWKFDGNALDSTPGRHAGTVTSATLTTDREGKASSAYSFNGSTSKIVMSTASLPLTTSFSYSAWINTSVTGANQAIIGGATSGGGDIEFRVSTNNKLYLLTFAGNVLCNTSSAPTSIAASTWYHVAVTYAGAGSCAFYINGVSQSVNQGSSATMTADQLEIGSFAGAHDQFTGTIDDVRVWNRVISATEATALYNQYGSDTKLASAQNGLVGWWKLNGNAKDSTPNRNNGTVTSATLTTDRKGIANSAYSFGSTSSVISVSDAPALNLTGDLSIEAWVNVTDNGNYQALVSKMGSSSGEYEIGADFRSGFNQNLSFRYNSFSTSSFNNFFTGYTGTWVHVALTVSGTTVKAYRNGVLYGTNTGLPSRSTTTDPFLIGKRSTFFTNGSISDVRLYNRALSGTEVATAAQSYNSQINLETYSTKINLSSGLIGYWPFNGNAKDVTPYRDNGTVNGATLTSDRNSRSSSAYAFSGTNSSISVGTPSTFASLTRSGFTYSIWLESTGTSSGQWPTIMGNNTHTYYAILSSNFSQNAYFEWAIPPYNNTAWDNVASTTLPLNTWHMVTYTYDGSNVRGYKDGSLYVTKAITGTNALNPTFGGLFFSNSGAAGFTGNMDDARVYNRALSATEISALYNEYR